MTPEMTQVFRALLTTDRPVVLQTLNGHEILVRRGWFDVSVNEQSQTISLEFPSPLHRVFWSSYLTREPLDPRFQTMSLQRFLEEVLSRLNPTNLRDILSTDSSSTSTELERRLQMEFYRAACDLTDFRAIHLLPGFNTTSRPHHPGRMDFYVDEKKWGIEILRKGEGIEEHLTRVRDRGVYYGLYSVP